MKPDPQVAQAIRQRERFEAALRDTPEAFVPLYTRLQHLRTAQGWSRGTLAKAMNVAVSTIQKWEVGRCRPSLYLLRVFVLVMGVTWEFLLEGVIPTSREVTGARRLTIATPNPKRYRRVRRMKCRGSGMGYKHLAGKPIVCPICQKDTVVRKDGRVRKHWAGDGK